MEQINRIWEEEETAPTIPEKDTYQQPPMFVCAWAFLLFFCYLVLIKLIEFSVVTPCLKNTQHQHTYNHNVSSSHTLLFSFLPLNIRVYVCVRIPVIPFLVWVHIWILWVCEYSPSFTLFLSLSYTLILLKNSFWTVSLVSLRWRNAKKKWNGINHHAKLTPIHPSTHPFSIEIGVLVSLQFLSCNSLYICIPFDTCFPLLSVTRTLKHSAQSCQVLVKSGISILLTTNRGEYPKSFKESHQPWNITIGMLCGVLCKVAAYDEMFISLFTFDFFG